MITIMMKQKIKINFITLTFSLFSIQILLYLLNIHALLLPAQTVIPLSCILYALSFCLYTQFVILRYNSYFAGSQSRDHYMDISGNHYVSQVDSKNEGEDPTIAENNGRQMPIIINKDQLEEERNQDNYSIEEIQREHDEYFSSSHDPICYFPPFQDTSQSHISCQHPDTNPEFRQVFKTCSLQKNENSIRFLVRMAIQYLPDYKFQYSRKCADQMKRKCDFYKEWRLRDTKKNNFNQNMLKQLFVESEQFDEQTAKKNRQVFNKVLRMRWRDGMSDPKSQIKNKAEYLRISKVFALRCRNKYLIERTESH